MGSQDERPATDLNSREPSEAVPRWCVLAGASLVLGLLSIGWLWWSLTTAPDPLVGMLLSAGAGAGLVLLLCGLVQRRWARQLAGVMAGRFNARVERAVAERTLLERSRLLNALAYDLRQPLYAMSLATQSLQHQRAMRRFGSTLDQLHKALEAADELLDTINTIALLEAGAIQPRLAVFSVQAMLERIDRVHGPVASARGLHWTVTPSLEHARSDAILLERMLGQLITNAVRCTRQGGVLVSCRRRDTHLLIQVWDTGPGLNESELAHVFDLHYRGQTGTETENGVGLGLCIVHQAAQLLGIGLGVRSRVGHGTCFSLRVPLAEAAEAAEAAR
jgi:two-component system, sensor histidine kinase LadS